MEWEALKISYKIKNRKFDLFKHLFYNNQAYLKLERHGIFYGEINTE